MLEHLRKVERGLLIGLFLSMVFLACGQIVLRNIIGIAVPWIDEANKVILLWIALLGATIAAQKNDHITIDLLANYCQPRTKKILARVAAVVTAVVCLICGYYSVIFISEEFSYGQKTFLSVPAWLCELIIPVCFLLLSVRYIYLIFNPVIKEHR